MAAGGTSSPIARTRKTPTCNPCVTVTPNEPASSAAPSTSEGVCASVATRRISATATHKASAAGAVRLRRKPMIAATSSARLLIGVCDLGERGYNAAYIKTDVEATLGVHQPAPSQGGPTMWL